MCNPCFLGLDSFLETCCLLSIPYLLSLLALSPPSSKGWASAVSLIILREDHGLFYYFWVMMNCPNVGHESSFYSRCLKVPGNISYKYS